MMPNPRQNFRRQPIYRPNAVDPNDPNNPNNLDNGAGMGTGFNGVDPRISGGPSQGGGGFNGTAMDAATPALRQAQFAQLNPSGGFGGNGNGGFGGYGIQGGSPYGGGFSNADAMTAAAPNLRQAQFNQIRSAGPYGPPGVSGPPQAPQYRPQSQPQIPQGPQPFGGAVNPNTYKAGGSYDATGTGAGYSNAPAPQRPQPQSSVQGLQGSGGGSGNAAAMQSNAQTQAQGVKNNGWTGTSSGWGGGSSSAPISSTPSSTQGIQGNEGGSSNATEWGGQTQSLRGQSGGGGRSNASAWGSGSGGGGGRGFATGGVVDPNDPNGSSFNPAPGFPGFSSGNQSNPVNPNPNNQNPSGASNTQPTSNYIQPNLRDVYDQFQNNRSQAGAWGQNFDATMGGNADYSAGMARGYDQLTPQLYGDIWNGGGGYTPGQQQEIRQDQGPTGLPQLYGKAQTEMAGNFLSPEEMAAASGNPYAGYDMYAGQVPKIESTNASGARNVGQSVNSMQEGFNRAIDPSQLSLTNGYTDIQANTVNRGVGQMNDVANNPELGITDQYAKQAGMTDAEVGQMAQARAAEVGSGYRSAQDQLEQNARASGTVNPLGIAAAGKQNEYESQMARGDALNRGELEARAAQRAAATGVEQTRLGARQYQSGMQRDVAQTGTEMQQGNAAQAEQMRLGAAQDLSGRNMTAAGTVGQAGLGAAEFNATNANNTANNTATQLADRYGTAADTQANRAYTLGTNRQGANTNAQATGFQQGMTVNDAASGRGTTIANQHQGQQAEGRQAAMGMGQYYGGQQNQQQQLRLGGQQVTGNLVDQATKGYGGWGTSQNATGFGSNFTKGFGGALGSSLGNFAVKGTGGAAGTTAPASSVMITPDGNYHPIGEDGPEMIVPLAPNRQGEWEYQPDRGGVGRSPTPGEVRSPYARGDYDMDDYGGPSDNDEDNRGGGGYACGGSMGGYASGGIIGTDDSDPTFTGRSPLVGSFAPMLRQSLGYAGGGEVPGPQKRMSPTGAAEYVYPSGSKLFGGGSASTNLGFDPSQLPTSSYTADHDTPSERTHERIHQAQHGLTMPDASYLHEIFKDGPGDYTNDPEREIPAYGLEGVGSGSSYDQSRYDLYLRALRERNPNGPTYRTEMAVPENVARENIRTQPPPYPQPSKPKGLGGGNGYASGGIIPGLRDPQPLRVAQGRIEMPSSTINHGGRQMTFHPPVHNYKTNMGKSKHFPGGASHYSEMGSMRSPAYG